ncbi:MAG: spermidine synthase [Roseimicrobium sp.]
MPSRAAVTLHFGLLSLLSAFLLFQVQPIIGKLILPWFGGTPSVWTTCMLFFQTVLFAGYAYAHALTRLPRRWQGGIHAVLVLAAVAVLPIAPGPEWKPTGTEDPAGRILLLLLANVALPYFVLSSTSPLVQVWFSRAGTAQAPWRLYALSNIGSLAALLSYPFLFEPLWSLPQQTWLWSGAFGLFALLSWLGAWGDWNRAQAERSTGVGRDDGEALPKPPSWWRRLLWLVLPAVASVLLLAATNHLCQDVAVIPFLWVVPLSLYLLTFIICFEHERWYVRVLWGLPALAVMLLAATHGPLAEILNGIVKDGGEHWWEPILSPDFRGEIALVCTAVFLGCMVCHGELARLKPHPQQLTEFYLMMSAGGALGGLFVTLVAPRLFTTYLEWPGVLLVTFAIVGIALLHTAWQLRRRWLRLLCAILLVLVFSPGIVFMALQGFAVEKRLERVRNFYGAISVEDSSDDDGAGWRTLYHGGIIHGTQYLAEEWRDEPISYYGPETGIGRALTMLKDRPDARVGVVGMGTATAAAYGQSGHHFRFYEINPEIVRIARQYFFYLGDMEKRGGTVTVAMGDARRNLEREPSQGFDVLLLDAFSGDSVPVHLLTREAFQIYLRHMKPDGVIAVHVSNRYLTLAPVVQKVALTLGWKTTLVTTVLDGFQETTDYLMVTNNEAFLKANPSAAPEEGELTEEEVSLWTDQKHNLFEILSE